MNERYTSIGVERQFGFVESFPQIIVSHKGSVQVILQYLSASGKRGKVYHLIFLINQFAIQRTCIFTGPLSHRSYVMQKFSFMVKQLKHTSALTDSDIVVGNSRPPHFKQCRIGIFKPHQPAIFHPLAQRHIQSILYFRKITYCECIAILL